MQTDELRPEILQDEDVKAAIAELFGYEALLGGMKNFLPPALYDLILHEKEQVNSVEDFQTRIVLPLMKAIEKSSISQLRVSGLEGLNPENRYLFISNHRDIILDSAYLNVVLFERGFQTSQIAIGDNLMKHRISELIFKINKSFVVRRTGTAMELYRYSVLLSEYIQSQILSGRDSVWIAQREGRAKDGNDRTQVGMLKMLSLANKGDLKSYFKALRIVPVSISYEYDPCDVLKTVEYLKKLADPDYKKDFREDVQHMLHGLKGFKGEVHFHFGKPLDEELDVFDTLPNNKKQLEALAALIDQSVHLNYALHAVNYVAYDMLTQRQEANSHYTLEEVSAVKAFFEQQFERMPEDENGLGRAYLLGMYANPLVNKLAAEQAD